MIIPFWLVFAAAARAEPLPQDLPGRQAAERGQLAQELDARMARLHESQDNDASLFQARLRQERADLEAAQERERRDFESSSKGDALADKKELRRELFRRQKASRAALEEDQRQRRRRFYDDQKTAMSAERQFERQRRRQLEDNQRLERDRR